MRTLFSCLLATIQQNTSQTSRQSSGGPLNGTNTTILARTHANTTHTYTDGAARVRTQSTPENTSDSNESTLYTECSSRSGADVKSHSLVVSWNGGRERARRKRILSHSQTHVEHSASGPASSSRNDGNCWNCMPFEIFVEALMFKGTRKATVIVKVLCYIIYSVV